MRKRLALCALFFPLVLRSQTDVYLDILNDPDVIWAAELNLQFAIEPENGMGDSRSSELNHAIPLKLLNPAPGAAASTGGSLREKLLNLCLNGRQDAFDPLHQNNRYDTAARRNILRSCDTITVIDPETYMEHTRVACNEPDARSINVVQVKQLLFYREKTAEFDLYTAAFAPVYDVCSNTEPPVFLYSRSPLWFNMPPWSPKNRARQPDLQDPAITWACRLTTLKNAPDLEEIRPFKDYKPPVMQQLLDRFLTDPGYSADYTSTGDPIPFENREALIIRSDTVVTFDPETYEEVNQEIRNDLTGYNVTRLFLSEDWYWDEKKQQLRIRLHAFGPLVERRNADAEVLFQKALFWHVKKG